MLPQILENYAQLTDSILALLHEERELLRQDPLPAMETLHERKRSLLRQLDVALAQLRGLTEENTGTVDRERMEFVQQKLMQILRLDREVEKLFLASGKRSALPEMVPAAAFVGNRYRNTFAS